MRKIIIGFAALLLVGCAANNHSNPPVYYTPPAPTVAASPAPTHTRVSEYPCGKEMKVHVGEGDVNLPKLDVVIGSEGKLATDGYVLHLKDATFTVRDYCRGEN